MDARGDGGATIDMGDNLQIVDLGTGVDVIELAVFGAQPQFSCAPDSYSWKCWGYDHHSIHIAK